MDVRLLDVDFYRGIKQRLLERPMAPFLRFLKNAGVEPNHITVAGFVINCITLPFMASNLPVFFLGTVLVYIFDGLDGLYARAAGKVTRNGHLLDKGLDFVSGLTVYFAGWILLDLPLALPAIIVYTLTNAMLFVLKLDGAGGSSCDFRLFSALGLPGVGLVWDIGKMMIFFPVRVMLLRTWRSA